MAENKKGFILYADQRGTFTKLSDEQAGKLVKHIFSYVNDENPESDFITELAFESIKQKLKRDFVKWEATRGKRSEAGLASAAAKKLAKEQTSTKSTSVESVQQAPTKSTVKDNVNVNVNVSVNDILLEKETKVFNEFWDLYDKKINPTKCKAKFLKLPEKDRKLIMEYIPKYKLSQPEKKFRKDPYTFLHNNAWLDEIVSDNGKTTPPPFKYVY